VGQVVAPVKSPKLEGSKLLICQPVGVDGERPESSSFIAVDRVQAGRGDLVLVNDEGGGARIVLADEANPVRALVVAVVDGVDVSPGPWPDPTSMITVKSNG
jgi:ethanolamine utilization protein EutN